MAEQSSRHEFGSPGWVDAIFDLIRQRAAAARPGELDAEYSLCEVFTNSPAHLTLSGESQIAWHVKVGQGRVICERGDLTAADKRTVADYAAVAPLGRIHIGDSEQAQAQIAKTVAEMIGKGELAISDNGTPQPEFLGGLHDDMVERTL